MDINKRQDDKISMVSNGSQDSSQSTYDIPKNQPILPKKTAQHSKNLKIGELY